MKLTDMKNALLAGELNERLTEVYGADAVALQQARYAKALDEFAALYGADRDVSLFSVSERQAIPKYASAFLTPFVVRVQLLAFSSTI